jgi:hypothetical protein
MAMTNRVRERMVAGLKGLQPIILQQKARDVSEADTVTVVKDILSEVLGFDKYAELTSEHSIRGTYCDLAVRIDDKLVLLIEVKAAGVDLDDRHVKQAIDYAANQGVDWVVLTNASIWRLYEVIFEKPIEKRLLIEVEFSAIDPRKQDQLENVFLFSREGFSKGACEELRDKQDATSRYTLAALLLYNDAVIATIRRELRRVVDVLVDDESIIKVLRDEVIKRDAVEGPNAEAATKRVNRTEAAHRAARTAEKHRMGVTEAGQDAALPADSAKPQPSPTASRHQA